MADAKIYCGDQSNLPGRQGYSRFGTRNECLKCGFGAAMYKYRWEPADNQPMPPPRSRQGCLRTRRHPRGEVKGNQFSRRSGGTSSPRQQFSPPFSLQNHHRTKLIIAIMIWSLACAVAFVLLFKNPPDAITKMENKKKVIKWDKFAGVYALIISGITAIVILSYSMINRSHGV